MPYLEALDHKLKMSKTPYFENSNAPSLEVDKAVYEEIKSKQLDLKIQPI